MVTPVAATMSSMVSATPKMAVSSGIPAARREPSEEQHEQCHQRTDPSVGVTPGGSFPYASPSG